MRLDASTLSFKLRKCRFIVFLGVQSCTKNVEGRIFAYRK